MAPDGKKKEMSEIALDYKAVWLCVKPCGLYGISNVFEHIINRKMEFLKNGMDSKSIKRRKCSKFANRIEGWNTRGKESTIHLLTHTLVHFYLINTFSLNKKVDAYHKTFRFPLL